MLCETWCKAFKTVCANSTLLLVLQGPCSATPTMLWGKLIKFRISELVAVLQVHSTETHLFFDSVRV